MKKLRTEQYLFGAVMALAAVLRLVCLGSMPGGLHQDESFVAWNAFAIFHEGMDSAGHVMPVYMADWGDGHSALYVWLTLPLLALNGGHVTPFLSRLPQALTGILTIGALYGVIRRLLGRGAALWTSFLLAVCPWHVMMSRWGLDANLAPGFLIFGLYFFVRALSAETQENPGGKIPDGRILRGRIPAKGKFLLLSAFFYGLALYSYAVIWPIVPLMLMLQILYGLWHRKLCIDRWSLLSAFVLLIMALPLLLFLLVNSGILPQIELPFLTIPRMGGYRGGEVAFDLARMWSNLRTALSLLWHQNTGAPYDVLLPWGLFYDVGRVFIVIGALLLSAKVLRGLWRREYAEETLLLIQLAGGGVVCLLVTAVLHQINALYIPLVICEGYGVFRLLEGIRRHAAVWGRVCGCLLAAVYLLCLAGFQRDYYTSYRKVADAYFGAGVEECVEYALEACGRTGIRTVTAEQAAQWPRLLLYTETLPSAYLESVVYDAAPAPASFRAGDILIRTRIDKERIDTDSIYILYYIDRELFEEEFELVPFRDWYVAVPEKYIES